MMASNSNDFEHGMLRSLEGIVNATKIDRHIIEHIKGQISAVHFQDSDTWRHSLQEWLDAWPSADSKNEVVDHVTKLALAVTYLRAKAHGTAGSTKVVSGSELALIWDVLRGALHSALFKQAHPGRSHQGFFSLPFCRLAKENGDNDEFWRLHVWLPGSPKQDSRFLMHSHQSFGQSWVLAGEAENTMWITEPTDDSQTATNAIYKLTEAFNKTLEAGSKEEVSGTIVQNTGKKVIVTEQHRERYCRGQSYLVPENAYHTTGVESDTVLATIFFFDASQGFVKEAGISIGPVDGTEFKQYRNPEGVQLNKLVDVVEAVRKWETEAESAFNLAKGYKWAEASKTFEKAADAWNVDGQRFLNVQHSIEAKEFNGLERYEEVAQVLQTWANHMSKGDFEKAKAVCEPLPRLRIVKQCSELASSSM